MKKRLMELISEVQYLGGLEEKVADILLANGVLVPPVKIGQTVYRIYWDYKIDVCKVSALTQKSDKSWKMRITSGINRSVFEVTPSEIGKIIFLTKWEAEKALAERSGE
ncbi:MAG: hypothetical protein J6S23_04050 [Clostridia bacterium]|nr:hypothetical protein [Clostridia bacterium]